MNLRSIALALMLSTWTWAQDISDYGLVLGGVYSTLSGNGAKNMAIYVQDMEFDEGLVPFRSNVNALAEPSGAFGPMIGGFIRVEFNEWFYVRVDANYLWKGAEYTTTLDTMDTYGGRDSLDMIYAMNQSNPSAEPVLPGFRRILFTNAYVEIPILVGFNATREFSLFLGPHISILAHNSFELHITEGRFVSQEGRPLSFGKKSYTDLKQNVNLWDLGLTVGANYIVNDQFQLGLRWAPGSKPFLDMQNPPDITQSTLQLVASMNFSEF